MKKLIEDKFNVEVRYRDGSYGAVDHFAIFLKDQNEDTFRGTDEKGFPRLAWSAVTNIRNKGIVFYTTHDTKKFYFTENLISVEFSRSYEDSN